MGGRTIVIAEIGENHVGDWDRARHMVIAAAKAGADVVKFQSYLGADVADEDPEKEWFTKVQVSDEMHFELKALAERYGLGFLSSPFSLDRAKFLVQQLGLQQIKVASSEMLNVPLLTYLNKRVSTVFLSTGLATLEEIRQAVGYLHDVKDLFIMQCTTQYPCQPCDANLNVINTLRSAFPRHHVGYSDHTIGIQAALAAVALGAEVIEKHFTLDKTLPGTDHVLSADPSELEAMVKDIRHLETLLGDSFKKPTPGEEAIKGCVRSRFAKSHLGN